MDGANKPDHALPCAERNQPADASQHIPDCFHQRPHERGNAFMVFFNDALEHP